MCLDVLQIVVGHGHFDSLWARKPPDDNNTAPACHESESARSLGCGQVVNRGASDVDRREVLLHPRLDVLAFPESRPRGPSRSPGMKYRTS